MKAIDDPIRPAGGGARRTSARAAACLAVLIIALGAGCVSRTRTPYLGPLEPRPDRGVRLARIAAEPLPPLAPRLRPLRERSPRHRRYALEAVSVTDNGQPGRRLAATFYEHTGVGRRPLVVVLPIWGSSAYPPRKIVRWLTGKRHGGRTNVLWLHGDEELIDWQRGESARTLDELEAAMEHWAATIRGTAIDIRRLIAWAHGRPAVARDRVGLVGFSMSAIVGSLVLGTEPRVSAGVLVAGGGNLHEIVATCRNEALVVRTAVEERFGMDAAAFARWLEPIFAPADPVHYAGGADPRGVLMIDAGRDGCVPETARRDLWLALGRPERITLDYGHRMSFLSMTFLGFHYASRQIVDHLERTLLDPRPRSRRPAARPADVGATAPAGPGSRPQQN